MKNKTNNEPQKSQFPPEEADLKERIEGFNKKLLPLLGKYELGLAAMPKILSDGRIGADPVIVSMRQMRKEEAAKTNTPPGPKVEGGLSKPE